MIRKIGLKRAALLGGIALATAAVTFACKQRGHDSDVLAAGDNVGIKAQRAFPRLSFTQPVAMVNSPDGKRWYVLEKPGRVMMFDNNEDADQAVVALDLTDAAHVVADELELGLLNMIFHPNGNKVFIAYTGRATQGGTKYEFRLSRFDVQGDGRLNKNSEKRLITEGKNESIHNGSGMAFQPGTTNLFISIGEAGDPNNSANPKTLKSKISRIDVDGTAVNGAYGIPNGNPFANDQRFRPEIWAWGLRNPWRIAVDTDGTLYCSDVGANQVEEVNVIEPGKNYGWAAFEGLNKRDGGIEQKMNALGAKFAQPKVIYDHKLGLSITGGVVYRGKDPAMAPFVGKYLFADFVQAARANIWAIDVKAQTKTLVNPAGVGVGSTISSFATAKNGDVFVTSFASGNLNKLVAGPPIVNDPNLPLHLWLSADGSGTEASATDYYRSICAIQDGQGNVDCGGEKPSPTLDSWVDQFLDGKAELAALYQNIGDLGFWRDMNCSKAIEKGKGGCYVTNWPNPDAKAAFEAKFQKEGQSVGNQAEFDKIKDLGTVTMNVSPQGFTRFYVFVPGVENGKFVRKLSKIAILDSEGAKAVPNLCTVCHGGQYAGAENADMGSGFREFHPFVLKRHPAKSQQDAEKDWFALNQSMRTANEVLAETARAAGKKPESDAGLANYDRLNGLLDYMYCPNGQVVSEDRLLSCKTKLGAGTSFSVARKIGDDDAVPPSWERKDGQNRLLTQAKIKLWKNFVEPYCLQCHRVNTLDFRNYDNISKFGELNGGLSEIEEYIGLKGEGVLKGDQANGNLEQLNARREAIKLSERRKGKLFMPNAVVTHNEIFGDKTLFPLQAMKEWLSQAGSDNTPLVQLTFKVVTADNVTRLPHDEGGNQIVQDVWIGGSIQALGAQKQEALNNLNNPVKWEITSGLKLAGRGVGNGTLEWTGKVRVPAGSKFRFKPYILQTGAGETLRWACAVKQTGIRATADDETKGDNVPTDVVKVRTGKEQGAVDDDFIVETVTPDSASEAVVRLDVGRMKFETQFHKEGAGGNFGCQ